MTIGPNTEICASCKQPLSGKYCSNCGEKRRHHHDLSLGHQLEEAFEGVTHFDNKFFKTMKLLWARPGQLTLNFVEGERVPYMKPIQLFVVCNLLFFLLMSHGNMFALQLYTYYDFDPYVQFGTRQVIDAKAAAFPEKNNVAGIFNERITTQSKAFILLFIPVFGLGSWLFFCNKRKYLAEHLIFATHFFSFLVLYYVAFHLLVTTPARWFYGDSYNETFDISTSILGLLLITAYYGVAARRFYKAGWFQVGLASLGTAVLFFVGLYGYRMLLFYKIIHSIH